MWSEQSTENPCNNLHCRPLYAAYQLLIRDASIIASADVTARGRYIPRLGQGKSLGSLVVISEPQESHFDLEDSKIQVSNQFNKI